MLLNAPLEVLWSLTGHCNLKCVFCLADAGPNLAKNELGESDRKFIVDELIKNQVLKVYLTGGEPLLCSEIISYVKKLQEHNIFVEITTNGTLLDNKLIKELKKTTLNRVQVSINGSSPQVNDSLMGPSHDRIIKAIQKLLSAGISTHVKVTLTRQNLDDIPNLVNLLHCLGIKQMQLCEVMALGRGFENQAQLAPAQKDLAKLQDKMAKFNELNNTDIHFRSFSLALNQAGRADSCSLGGQSLSTCLIMADGNLIPCASGNIWQIKNNVIEKGLKRCWTDLEVYGQFIDHCKLKGKCANCDLKRNCQGGCRARAYQFTNDLWEQDPLCPYPVKPSKKLQITNKVS